VNFIRLEDAEKAVKTMNGLRLQNKTIKVNNSEEDISVR
jgi:RNA recognition motif-containing protein